MKTINLFVVTFVLLVFVITELFIPYPIVIDITTNFALVIAGLLAIFRRRKEHGELNVALGSLAIMYGLSIGGLFLTKTSDPLLYQIGIVSIWISGAIIFGIVLSGIVFLPIRTIPWLWEKTSGFRVQMQINRLRNGVIGERRYAVRELGRMRNREAIAAVIQALEDPVEVIRLEAVEAAGQLGNPAAVAALIQRLEDPELVIRLRAILALGQLGDNAAVPALIRLLDDANAEVRLEAALCLRDIGDERALPALRKKQALDHELVDGKYAVSAIAELAITSIEKRLANQS